MKRLLLLSCLGAALLAQIVGSAAPVPACSRIILHRGKITTVARTWDLYMHDKGRLVAFPRGTVRNGGVGPTSLKWTARYGSVGVYVFDAGTADGMNEKGLGVHLLYLHGTKYEPRDSRPGVANALWAQYLLDTCGTVEEVVATLGKFQVVSVASGGREWPLHLACEDATGDSAIIEYVAGKMVVHHGKDYPVMTNEPALDEQLANLKRYRLFGGTLPLPGDIDPKSRFVRAASFLKTLPDPNGADDAMALVLGAIKTTVVPYGAHDTSGGDSEDVWPTRWISGCDFGQRLYYFSSTRSPNAIWLDFGRLNLAEGAPVMSLDPYDTSLVGEVSGKLQVRK